MVLRAMAMNAARSLASWFTSVCFANSRTASTMALLSWVRSLPADSGLMIGDMECNSLPEIGAAAKRRLYRYSAPLTHFQTLESVQNQKQYVILPKDTGTV